MKKNYRNIGKYWLIWLMFCLSQLAMGQSFTGTYNFASVTTTSGTTDPTPVPTATGLTFGSFSSAGVGINPNAGGVFSYTGWSLGATNGSDTFTGALDPNDYYSVTFTPSAGCTIDLSTLTFDAGRSTTGPRHFAVRSSLDGFAANLPASTSNVNVSIVATDVFQIIDNTSTAIYGTNTITLGTQFDAVSSGNRIIFLIQGKFDKAFFSIDSNRFAGVRH